MLDSSSILTVLLFSSPGVWDPHLNTLLSLDATGVW